MPAETILEHLTIDGARSILYENEIGSLEIGKRADFLLFDLDRPEWVPLHNPISNLGHGASGDSVDTVVIDGSVIVEKRRIRQHRRAPGHAAWARTGPRGREANRFGRVREATVARRVISGGPS